MYILTHSTFVPKKQKQKSLFSNTPIIIIILIMFIFIIICRIYIYFYIEILQKKTISLIKLYQLLKPKFLQLEQL